jgi:hypothetical protein
MQIRRRPTMVRVLTPLAAAAMVSGCAGLQMPLGASQAAPHIETTKAQDLVYAADATTGTIYVLSYPQGTTVDTFSLPSGAGDPEGECADAQGNVWITSLDSGEIYKYRHGGTTAVSTLGGTGSAVYGCSVDPATGDLAAVSPYTGAAYIWHHATGTPAVFLSAARLYYCGYDSNGNLFMDGTAASSLRFALFELRRHSTAIQTIHINKRIKSVGQIQWDGSYVSIEELYPPSHVYRAQISGPRGKIVETVAFAERMRSLAQSWIAGDEIIVPFSARGQETNSIGLWKYPDGGAATATWTQIAHGSISAVALSAAR